MSKKRMMAGAFGALFLLVIAAGVYQWTRTQPAGAGPVVHIAGRSVHVDIADTPEERQQGLSGRPGLQADEGMLFVFPEDGVYGFWMKDMYFSIDMLWLAADGRVVYMAQNVSPSTYPTVFRPETPARYVLELPSGWAKAYTVRVGDSVQLQ